MKSYALAATITLLLLGCKGPDDHNESGRQAVPTQFLDVPAPIEKPTELVVAPKPAKPLAPEDVERMKYIAGQWDLKGVKGEAVTLNIDSGGSFSGKKQDCAFRGKLSPMADGEAFYDMAVTFSDACKNPGATISGLVISHLISKGQQRLLMVLRETSISTGYLIFGDRAIITK